MSTIADIWSLGVLYYELLYGNLPWNPNSSSEFITEILKQKQLNFPEEFKISQESKDFLLATLQVDPGKRIPANNLLTLQLFSPEILQIGLPMEFPYQVEQTLINIQNKIQQENIQFIELLPKDSQSINLNQLEKIISKIDKSIPKEFIKLLFDEFNISLCFLYIFIQRIDLVKEGNINANVLAYQLTSANSAKPQCNNNTLLQKNSADLILKQFIDKIQTSSLNLDKVLQPFDAKQQTKFSLTDLHNLFESIDNKITQQMTIIVFKQIAKKGQHITYQQFKAQLIEFSKILNNTALESGILDSKQPSDNNIQTQKYLEKIHDQNQQILQTSLDNIFQYLSSPKHQQEQPKQENTIEIEQLKQKYEYILEQTKQNYQELIAELNEKINQLEKQLAEKETSNNEYYKGSELSFEEAKLPSFSPFSSPIHSKNNPKELEAITQKLIKKIADLPNLGFGITNQLQRIQSNPPLQNLKLLLAILNEQQNADELISQGSLLGSSTSQQSKNLINQAQKQLQRKQMQLDNKELEIIKLQKQLKGEQSHNSEFQEEISQLKSSCKQKDNEISQLQKKLQNQALLKKEIEKSHREIIELQIQIKILYYKLKERQPQQLTDATQDNQQISKFLTPLKPSFFPQTYSTYLSGTQSTSHKDDNPSLHNLFEYQQVIDKNKLLCANDMELKRKDIKTFKKTSSFLPGTSALLRENNDVDSNSKQ